MQLSDKKKLLILVFQEFTLGLGYFSSNKLNKEGVFQICTDVRR